LVFVRRRKRRVWTDDEKRMICAQTRVAGVSVSQVARRYDVNANLVFNWLRDPRFAPGDPAEDGGRFLPVAIVPEESDAEPVTAPASASASPGVESRIEVKLPGGLGLRIVGGYDPEALARLIRGLSA
jgi:transposase